MAISIRGSSEHDARNVLTAWLALRTEEVLDPALPILDAHHHLRDYGKADPTDCYLFEDLNRDLSSGHHILGTVVVECKDNMYRTSGPAELRSIGEIEFLRGVAAMFASGRYGTTRACAGIVSFADLRLGDRVENVIDAQLEAAGGRLRGVRNPIARDDTELLRTSRSGDKDLLRDSEFRKGYARLAMRGLSFDAYVFHPQLPQLIDLARTFPDSTLIVNHCGGPLGAGPYAGRRDEIFAYWSGQLRELARSPGVFMKLGGLGMPRGGFGFDQRDRPAASEELADAWRPYIETCIDTFGPQRCMFESNFPSDKVSGSYRVFWNAFKRIAQRYSDAEKAALFSATAMRAYRLND